METGLFDFHGIMEIFPEMPHFHGTFRNNSMEMKLWNLMEMIMEINGNDRNSQLQQLFSSQIHKSHG
jgi:hypothetical protein